jgi:hypothetical protein
LKFAVAHVKPTSLLIVYGIPVLCILLISAATCICSVYGQISQLPTSSSSNVTGTTTKQPPVPSASKLLSLSSPIAHSVKITSPVKGQQVPIGNLAISGTSKDNINSNCYVNIIVNDVKPYQNTSASGPGGVNDYSNWTFNLTPKYTTLKEGISNKITAKFSCSSNPTLASFYSVNVTGISPAAGVQGDSSGGGQTKMASPMQATTTNSSNTTNQTRTIVSR